MKIKGYARVEFLALADDIGAKLKAGYTAKAIYNELLVKGKVSMSYRMFCRYANGYAVKPVPKNVAVRMESLANAQPSQEFYRAFSHKNESNEADELRLMGPRE